MSAISTRFAPASHQIYSPDNHPLQLGYVHLAVQPDATKLEEMKGRRAARQLQTKLDMVRYERGGIYEEVRGRAEILVKAFYGLGGEDMGSEEYERLDGEGSPEEDETVEVMEDPAE